MSRHSPRLDMAAEAVAGDIRTGGQVRLHPWCHARFRELGYSSPGSLNNCIRQAMWTHPELEGLEFTAGILHQKGKPPVFEAPAPSERPGRRRVDPTGDTHKDARAPRPATRLSDAYLRSIAARLMATSDAMKFERLDPGECAVLHDHLLELVDLRKAAGKGIPAFTPPVGRRESLGGLVL